jgi:hypothetical protein
LLPSCTTQPFIVFSLPLLAVLVVVVLVVCEVVVLWLLAEGFAVWSSLVPEGEVALGVAGLWFWLLIDEFELFELGDVAFWSGPGVVLCATANAVHSAGTASDNRIRLYMPSSP